MMSAMPLIELKTILLAGGFSESKLLQEGIQRHFPSIAVRTPSGPSTAVVKGAVDFGHCPEKIVVLIGVEIEVFAYNTLYYQCQHFS
jgi:molecular chaperone DnaK (HSP70)